MFPWAHWVAEANLENGHVCVCVCLADTVTQQLCNWNILYWCPLILLSVLTLKKSVLRACSGISECIPGPVFHSWEFGNRWIWFPGIPRAQESYRHYIVCTALGLRYLNHNKQGRKNNTEHSWYFKDYRTQCFNIYLSINHSSLYLIRVTIGLMRPCTDHGPGWLSGMLAHGLAQQYHSMTSLRISTGHSRFCWELGCSIPGNVKWTDSRAPGKREPSNAFTKCHCLLLNRLLLLSWTWVWGRFRALRVWLLWIIRVH